MCAITSIHNLRSYKSTPSGVRIGISLGVGWPRMQKIEYGQRILDSLGDRWYIVEGIHEFYLWETHLKAKSNNESLVETLQTQSIVNVDRSVVPHLCILWQQLGFYQIVAEGAHCIVIGLHAGIRKNINIFRIAIAAWRGHLVSCVYTETMKANFRWKDRYANVKDTEYLQPMSSRYEDASRSLLGSLKWSKISLSPTEDVWLL